MLLKEYLQYNESLENYLDLRSETNKEIISIINSNKTSLLVQFIIKRMKNPNMKMQDYKIQKIDRLKAYTFDPETFELFKNITSGDIGKGEVIISLLGGKWNGGTENGFDVVIPQLGKVEMKHLGKFERSSNVPLGSAKTKTIDGSDFYNLIKEMVIAIRSNPSIIKGLLNFDEMDYFINNTLGEMSNEQLETNSIKILGRLLRKAGNKFNTVSINRLKVAMENVLKTALGNADFIMFLGDPGLYYILPKKSLRYYMFYRIYNKNRIKIAPFMTEKEFFDSPLIYQGATNAQSL